ncbi:MAG: hypothetical protein ACYC7E_04215 [Armatimonadota bacterium]
MRYLLLFLLACAVLSIGSSVTAQGMLTVSVWPDKLLYDVGETAKIDVTVTNGGKDPVQGQLTVRVIWEMEDTQTLLQQPVELKAGEKKVVTATWKTAEVLGCEARAELQLDAKTTVAGSEYFNVCRAKDAQRVGIHTGSPNLFTWPEKAFIDSIPNAILNLRRGYANIIEHYSWAPDLFADMAPKQETWLSNYWQNKTAIKRSIEEEHKHGIKSLTYLISATPNVPGVELMRTHPEWFLYHPNGKPWNGGNLDVQRIDVSRNADDSAAYRAKYMYYGTGMYLFPNFSLKEPLDFGIQQLISSKLMFGWDGVRFDGHYVMWTAVCKGARDNTGKPVVSGKEAEAITKANTAYTKKEIFKVYPDFLFMFNASSQDPDIAEICSVGGAPANEPIKGAGNVNSQWNAWKDFTKYLLDDADRTRERGGYPYALLPPPWEVCPNVDRIQYPILFATTVHPWFCHPTLDRANDKGGTHYPIQKDFFRFATRYSALFWGHGIQRVKAPESLASVMPPTGNVWWKDFVYRRPLANGKQQLVIHLINEPPTPGIEADTQTLPTPISNIAVKFSGKVARAWVASAEPQLSCQRVPVENGTIKVPELRVWTVVIAETEGN